MVTVQLVLPRDRANSSVFFQAFLPNVYGDVRFFAFSLLNVALSRLTVSRNIWLTVIIVRSWIGRNVQSNIPILHR
jgi:hypothetical protein